MKKFVLSAALLFSALAGNAEGISSPSGMVKLDFELTKDGRPAYQVDYKGGSCHQSQYVGIGTERSYQPDGWFQSSKDFYFHFR